jgi:hypothetical protein
VSYFHGARPDHFRLEPFQESSDGLLLLRGESTYPALEFEITKQGGSPFYSYEASPVRRKRFAWRLRPPEGAGRYKINVFGYRSPGDHKKKHCGVFQANFSGKSLPRPRDLNTRLVAYVKANRGKRIGGGHCEDLLRGFFLNSGAMWKPHDTVGPNDPRLPRQLRSARDRERHADIALPEYGRRIDPAREALRPGDIVLYFMCVFRAKKRTTRVTSHVSVLYQRLKGKHWRIAHQGVRGQRHVVFTERDFGAHVSGVLRFYRPQQGLTAADG